MTDWALCAHYWPQYRRQCELGLWVPTDCGSCPAYQDGTPYLGHGQQDMERVRGWADAHCERAGPQRTET